MLAEHNKRKKIASAEAIEAGDIEALRDSLSYRQRRFCEEFVIDYKASAACRRAGYSEKYASRQSYQLLNHEGCKAYIDYLDDTKAAKITSVDPDYVVQKIVTIVNKENAKDTDKLRGLELLARHLGMFIEKTEISGPDGEAIKIEQQAKQEASAFLQTLQSMANKKKPTEVEIR